MPEVTWSKQADYDLETIVRDPAVRDQLKRNAEDILHDIPPLVCFADEGTDGQIMWHRGVAHGDERHPEESGGPQNYFLYYRESNPGPGFKILAVRSIQQIAESARRDSPPEEGAAQGPGSLLPARSGDYPDRACPGT